MYSTSIVVLITKAVLVKKVLILYKFDEQSFSEAYNTIGRLKNDDLTFVLLNYIEVNQHTNLLISVEDLIKKETIRKLVSVGERLQSCYPDLSLDIEFLALSTSETLPFTPDLVIQTANNKPKPLFKNRKNHSF